MAVYVCEPRTHGRTSHPEDYTSKKPKDSVKSAPATLDDSPYQTIAQRAAQLFLDMDGKKPLATISNLRVVLKMFKIDCRYNVISKKNEHFIAEEEFTTDNEEPAALACVYSRMKQCLLPVDGYKGYLLKIADENQYNPVLEWVRSKPWDGLSRLQEFYNTIESPENEAKELLLRRWLITAMSMAYMTGIDSAGCLVLQGPQDLGKTWWCRKLVPPELRKRLIRTDSSVDPSDRDSVSQIISYWIVELGEIGATFRKADLDALKTFITKETDIMRRPYGEGDMTYPRRTAMIASVDQHIYLHDTAGNRRFWTIPCTSINSYHEIDMQQLWAEILDLIENKGETWQLQPDEKAHIARINEEHMQIEPLHEMILEKYRWDEMEFLSEWKTSTRIALDLSLKSVTQKETRIIANYIKKINGDQRKRSNGKDLLKVPAIRL